MCLCVRLPIPVKTQPICNVLGCKTHITILTRKALCRRAHQRSGFFISNIFEWFQWNEPNPRQEKMLNYSLKKQVTAVFKVIADDTSIIMEIPLKFTVRFIKKNKTMKLNCLQVDQRFTLIETWDSIQLDHIQWNSLGEGLSSQVKTSLLFLTSTLQLGFPPWLQKLCIVLVLYYDDFCFIPS